MLYSMTNLALDVSGPARLSMKGKTCQGKEEVSHLRLFPPRSSIPPDDSPVFQP